MDNVTTNRKLSEAQQQYLRKLGLSNDAIELYELLLKQGSLTAHASSILRGTYSSAEYRLFYGMEKLGLVRHSAGRPRVFSAVAVNKGLQAAYTNTSNQLSRLLAAADDLPAAELEIIVGRQALYQRYIELAEAAEHEIWVYAIGIAYSAELEALQRRLMKRGMTYHHIVQEVRPTNYHILRKWQRLGMRVKHLPSERGFHLMVFDHTHVVITFSDPANTDDRLSVVTNNQQAIRMFRAQFQTLWSEAQEIKQL